MGSPNITMYDRKLLKERNYVIYSTYSTLKLSLLNRCSARTKCGRDKQTHNLQDLEKCYLEVKDKFVKWNDEREEKLVLLEVKVIFLLE